MGRELHSVKGPPRIPGVLKGFVPVRNILNFPVTPELAEEERRIEEELKRNIKRLKNEAKAEPVLGMRTAVNAVLTGLFLAAGIIPLLIGGLPLLALTAIPILAALIPAAFVVKDFAEAFKKHDILKNKVNNLTLGANERILKLYKSAEPEVPKVAVTKPLVSETSAPPVHERLGSVPVASAANAARAVAHKATQTSPAPVSFPPYNFAVRHASAPPLSAVPPSTTTSDHLSSGSSASTPTHYSSDSSHGGGQPPQPPQPPRSPKPPQPHQEPETPRTPERKTPPKDGMGGTGTPRDNSRFGTQRVSAPAVAETPKPHAVAIPDASHSLAAHRSPFSVTKGRAESVQRGGFGSSAPTGRGAPTSESIDVTGWFRMQSQHGCVAFSKDTRAFLENLVFPKGNQGIKMTLLINGEKSTSEEHVQYYKLENRTIASQKKIFGTRVNEHGEALAVDYVPRSASRRKPETTYGKPHLPEAARGRVPAGQVHL